MNQKENPKDAQDFNRAFEIIVGVEGGFSDDPNDPGNWTSGKRGIGLLKGTQLGISAAAYPNEDIRAITRERAEALYRRDYWDKAECPLLEWPLNCMVFDGAVQHDPVDARELLQKALGVNPDGDIGPVTLRAIQRHGWREAAVLYLNTRLDYYQSLGSWKRYGDGWVNRLFRVALAA